MQQKQLTTPQLIDKLENITSSKDELEQHIVDVAVWFHRNLPRVQSADVRQQLDFYGKALDNLIGGLALTAQRLQKLEGRRNPVLWIPPGAGR